MRNNSYSRNTRSRGYGPRTNSRYGQRRRQNRRPNHGQYINPEKFINKATAAFDVIPEPTHKFTDFGLLQELEQTLKQRGYEQPTPVQDEAIKPAMEGRDVIGIANTGTGKTAAFVLPIIHRLKLKEETGRVLIMAPTRELAGQIDDEFRAFARGMNLYSVLCVGGMSIQPQKRGLSRKPQVIIGTPGRLKDLFQQKAYSLHDVGTLVLDEADRMLDMGFLPDIKFLIDKLPTKKQTLCFSATLAPAIRQLMDQLLNDPVMVSVRTSDTSGQVEQNVIKASSKEQKIEMLLDLLSKPEFDKVLVFGQTKIGVQRLSDTLKKHGKAVDAIHGNKSQQQRQRKLRAFKEGHINILVATDVAARGLDIPNVSHVINFDQPHTYDDYIHRIGRTGRAGSTGHALTFIER